LGLVGIIVTATITNAGTGNLGLDGSEPMHNNRLAPVRRFFFALFKNV
jgi:hypothetical protein